MENPFEQHIKQSLENYEAKYNPADWSDLQNKLNKTKTGKVNIGKGLMIAASVAAVAGAIYYFSTNPKQEKTIVQNTVITNNESTVISQQDKLDVLLSANNKQQTTNNNSLSKEKTVGTAAASGKKSVSPEKIETQTINKTPENKIFNKEQTPNSEPPTPNPATIKATFHADMNKVCEGSPVQFTSDNNEDACTYQWNFGDGETSIEKNPQHTYIAVGNYSVKLLVASIKDKKSDEQIIKNIITVQPASAVDFSYSLSEDNKLVVVFDGSADNIISWNWDFGDKKSASEENPTHAFPKYNTYKVIATAKNNFGCTSSISKNVVVKNEINLLAPTSFSPNGDGLNDTWMPVALQSGNYDFTLTVYDKSNTIVFSTSDKNNSWVGANTKPGDTYSWKADVKEKNGMQSTHQGFIIIK